MDDLDLKSHFLQKLEELRFMKEEYYAVPKPLDAAKIL